MVFNISFGSMFNPEKAGRRSVESGAVNPEHNIERLNAHQQPHSFGKVGKEPVEHMEFGRVGSAPSEFFVDEGANNLENLKHGGEVKPSGAFPLTFQESLGRSQVKSSQIPKKIELNENDRELLSKLSSKKYGFHGTSNDFWMHSSKKNEDGTYSMAMGDGKLQGGTTRADFIKSLVKKGAQGFDVAGTNKDGKKIRFTFVYDKEEDATTCYSSDCHGTKEATIGMGGYQTFESFAKLSVDEFDTIYGATVWQ